jgi:hypothetical protein
VWRPDRPLRIQPRVAAQRRPWDVVAVYRGGLKDRTSSCGSYRPHGKRPSYSQGLRWRFGPGLDSGRPSGDIGLPKRAAQSKHPLASARAALRQSASAPTRSLRNRQRARRAFGMRRGHAGHALQIAAVARRALGRLIAADQQLKLIVTIAASVFVERHRAASRRIRPISKPWQTGAATRRQVNRGRRRIS